MIPFRTEHTGSPMQDRIQDAFKRLLQALDLVPFLRGRRVDNITVTTTLVVRHGLGRPLRGYIVLQSYGTGGEVPLINGPGPDPLNDVEFAAGANPCTVDLWLF